MRVKHGFFIPDLENLSDPGGLVSALLQRVVEGRCLFCRSEKTYEDPLGAQQHMIDKGHCRMRYEEDEDFELYSGFYTYPEGEAEDADAEDDEGLVEAKLQGRRIIQTPKGEAYVNEAGDLVFPGGHVARNRIYMKYFEQKFSVPDPRLMAQLERLALEYQTSGVATQRAANAMEALLRHQRSSRAGVSDTAFAQRAEMRKLLQVKGRGGIVAVQKAEGDYRKDFALKTAFQQNIIRRLRFRVAATGEGH
jgi:hypothetical protein